jgi:hypothetical protein
LKKILTAALMGYFMIIVFSISGIPNPNKPIDALTAATKPAQVYNKKIQYAEERYPLPGDRASEKTTSSTFSMGLNDAIRQRSSVRVFDNNRPLDFQMIGQLVKKALTKDALAEDRIKVFGLSHDNKFFVFEKESATFQPLPVPEEDKQGPGDICFADFVKKAPGILFITGRDDNQSCMEAGRFCQAMSLSFGNKKIGSCIVGWFDPQIANTQLYLDRQQKLLLALAFGFSAPISN